MYNCSDDILSYHDDAVTLPAAERDAMRGRRDANRSRLTAGLTKEDRPPAREFWSQGSYAMKTMVQHPANDYDIDDGVYFDATALVGPRGADISALDARKLVRDAVDDGSFATPPEVRTNCVRIYYEAGCHVDMPVYRRRAGSVVVDGAEYYNELASTEWKRSDARDVTKWFEEANKTQSPDTENGGQLRRVVRHVKKLARSRASWTGQILSGFGITALIVECYHADAAREDVALFETMLAMRDRLDRNLVVDHPVTPNDTITIGPDDPKARFLRDRLSDVLGWLQPLLAAECDRDTALRCWDKVFSTSFFTDRATTNAGTIQQAQALPRAISGGLLKTIGAAPEVRAAVKKEGGGRYA
jgi:hypothetical protein